MTVHFEAARLFVVVTGGLARGVRTNAECAARA